MPRPRAGARPAFRFNIRMRRLRRLLPLAAVLVLTACGGGGGDKSAADANPAGAKVFADAGCGGCHTLSAASSKGTVGPNLDSLQLSSDRVVRQVENGGNGMPSFSSKLSDQQIKDVAAFVAASAGTSNGKSVAGKFEPDDTKLSSCASGSFPCYEQGFGNLAYAEGARVALTELDRRMRTETAVLSDCHRIAHSIGAAALARADGNVAKAFVEGTATCGSGFYHGLIERAFVGVPESRLAIAADGVCKAKEIQADAFRAYQCVHGLGHGLMIYTGYDLPQSLRVCDDLSEQFNRVSCTGGVFMENAQSSYGVKSRWLKDDDLIYPCDKVAERHKYYCYLLVTSRILPAVGGSLERTAEVCRQSERDWIGECFESFGRDVSGIARQNGDKIIPYCRLAKANEGDCVYGAVRDIANNDANTERAAVFCTKVRVGLRGRCWEGVGTMVGALNTYEDQRRQACTRLTPKYEADCARGAGIPA